MQHPRLDSCIVTEKIVKLSCKVKSLYFTMAEPKRRYLVPGYQVTLVISENRTLHSSDSDIFVDGRNKERRISKLEIN